MATQSSKSEGQSGWQAQENYSLYPMHSVRCYRKIELKRVYPEGTKRGAFFFPTFYPAHDDQTQGGVS